MKVLRPLLLCAFLAPFCLPSAHASEEGAAGDQARPGLFHRMLHPFGHSGESTAGTTPALKGGREGWRHLTLTMTLEPQPLRLGVTRQLTVKVQLLNKSKFFAQMEFPTTQRIEVLVKNSSGKMVEQWSEDRAFTDEPGIISINPGERLEYSATLATRDMVPAESYTIEAFFPHYEALRAQRTIVPGK